MNEALVDHDFRTVRGPTPQIASEADEIPVLTRYLRIILRWKRVIIGVIFASLVIGATITLLMTPLYTATTTIEISREGDKIVQIEGVEKESSAADLEFYQTQYGLLKSRSLAERVALDLKLVDDPKFFDLFGKSLRDETYSNIQTGRLNPASRADRVRKAGEILLDSLTVTPVRLSRLVEISFTTPDPLLSARITNAWAAHFIESNLERRFQATSYARKFLEDRLEQLRSKLEESERLLVRYASSQTIINIPGVTDDTGKTIEHSLLANDLATLNTELSAATADRVRAESRLSELKGGGKGAVAEALNNTAIANLRQKRAEVASEYARILVQFEPDYPVARALASQVNELDQSIAREVERVQTSFRTAFRESLARERGLRERVNALKSGLLDLRRRSIQYNIYQRDVDTNRQLYDGLLQRYKEIGVAGGIGTNNISVVDPADAPQNPSRPRLMINLLLSLLIGTAVAIALTFALEQIDETISDPADVEKTLDVPLLGAVPKSAPPPVEALVDRKSPIVEAYLAVQTNLEFSSDHGVPRSLSVTSTRPSEGKSTTAYALALALAMTNRKVLLIDGDMRSPSVHDVLGLNRGKGLSNLLAGSDDIDEAIQQTWKPNLFAMTAGPLPPNAAELLTGDRLPRMLKILLQRFDHVVIDSPPVMGLADAPLVASRVEGTVFAVESHGIRVRLVRVALKRLSNANARILGVVLTKFQSERAHFGYGYDYGYGYGSEKPTQS